MKAQLEAERARLGLGAHVQLVGHWDDMAGLYRELDLLVCTSHSEAMPLALMEAMASMRPPSKMAGVNLSGKTVCFSGSVSARSH